MINFLLILLLLAGVSLILMGRGKKSPKPHLMLAGGGLLALALVVNLVNLLLPEKDETLPLRQAVEASYWRISMTKLSAKIHGSGKIVVLVRAAVDADPVGHSNSKVDVETMTQGLQAALPSSHQLSVLNIQGMYLTTKDLDRALSAGAAAIVVMAPCERNGQEIFMVDEEPRSKIPILLMGGDQAWLPLIKAGALYAMVLPKAPGDPLKLSAKSSPEELFDGHYEFVDSTSGLSFSSQRHGGEPRSSSGKDEPEE